MAIKRQITGALIALLAVLPLTAGEEELVTRPQDIEGMYTHAAFILDDRSTDKVYGVTAMLEKCAQWGHPLAIELLLNVYEGRRKGLEAQPRKAAALAELVAEGKLVPDAHHPEQARVINECKYRYALYCEKAFGRERSEKEALRWMLRAANAGVGKARVELARYLMNPKKPYSDPRRSLQLLRHQAKLDPHTPNVFFYLGHLYMTGKGLPRPMPQLAFECYQLGEKMKDARAINNLAAMYERGIATSRDLSTALLLYKKAAALGNKEASANVQRLAYIRAELEVGTPHSLRIIHATQQLIEALPISQANKKRLSAPLRKQAAKISSDL